MKHALSILVALLPATASADDAAPARPYGSLGVTSDLTLSGPRPRQRFGADVTVFVRSVLPADSALRVLKPARALWETPAFPWWIVAVAAAIAALALWWWWRRRRRAPQVAWPTLEPFVRAQLEFDRLDAMGLVEAGERTRYVTLAVEVLRDYLVSRYPDARLALTSRGLVAALRRRDAVPIDALSRTLHEADLAKFAGVGLTDERARTVAREARGVVALHAEHHQEGRVRQRA